jgi:hypothetical protein
LSFFDFLLLEVDISDFSWYSAVTGLCRYHIVVFFMFSPVSPLARVVAEVVPLLVRYRYEPDEMQAAMVAQAWVEEYPAEWVRPAVVETLYQGRYKSVSVAQVLRLWQRQGRPHIHYPGDFERLVIRSPAERGGASSSRVVPRSPLPLMPATVTEPQYQKLRTLAQVQPLRES